jgi:cytochrome bd-type quinol oxidase subunit 2
MQGWAQFYAVVAAVAATLMGLLFVAVSVNAEESVGPSHDTSRRLAEQALQNYLTTVLIALVALTPDITTRSFGVVTVSLTVVAAILTVVRLTMLLRSDEKIRHVRSIQRYGSSILGFAMLIYSALRMSLGDGDHRTMLAISLMVLLGSATMMSWELLLRIAARPTDT